MSADARSDPAALAELACLRPWRDERVLAADQDLLAVDKPPGIVVHGGDEVRGDDLVSRLAAYLRARGTDDYLGVHQRLDKDASGVLVFTRRREVNPAVARDFEGHLVSRVYLAAVGGSGLAAEGVLEHRLEHEKGGVTRVVSRGGKRAVTRYRVLERGSGRALVELRPETGRTHQLRAQLAAVGAPIAGDRWYGGEPALRLMLHASALELPSLARRFEAPAPACFAAWVAGVAPGLGEGSALADALADAAVLRWSLAGRASAFRLVNELGDGLPGVTVDRYGDFAVLAVSTVEAIERKDELAALLLELGVRGVYLKLRERGDARRVDLAAAAPADPIAGEAAPDPLGVREGDLRFAVRLGDGLSTGLFVDQRDNRALVRSLARGARVLNTFAYTCSFSLAAAAGGAREVVSVDLSRRSLDRGRTSFVDNGIDPGPHRFEQADAVDWLARAAKRGERFDLVVLDPPSFGTRGKHSTFDVATGYQALAASALGVLSPGGRLLAVTNHRKTSRQRLRKMLHEAARRAGRQVAQLKDLPSPLDCPDGPDGPLPAKAVLATVRS